MAAGILLLLLAVWLFMRTTVGNPRLVNVLLKGKQAAIAEAN